VSGCIDAISIFLQSGEFLVNMFDLFFFKVNYFPSNVLYFLFFVLVNDFLSSSGNVKW
jgi:hypothetical protein